MSGQDLNSAIQSVIAHKLRSTPTGQPGKILRYDADTQLANVQLLIKNTYVHQASGKIFSEDFPPILDVPVMFPGSGENYITFPVSEGDLVWVSFCDFELDGFVVSGKSYVPSDTRSHSLADCVAIPGIRPKNVNLGKADGVVLNGKVYLGSSDSSDPVALKSDLQDLIDAINSAVLVLSDGGASFKSTLLAGLASKQFPKCSKKVKAE